MGGSGRVFLCPGRQRGQKVLYLGQTSLPSGRAQSLFYLGFLPLPRGSGVNRCSHTGLEGPSITSESLTSSCSAPSLLSGSPWLPAGGGRVWTKMSSEDWDRDLKSACPESHELRGGRRTGSAVGSTGACWSCGQTSCGQTAKWRCYPFP